MRIILSFLAFAFLISPVTAMAENPADVLHTKVRLYSPVTATGSGETADIGLEIIHDKGWKSYWRTPGEAGLPPRFDWSGSANLKSVDVSYPVPHRFTVFDIDNFGYSGSIHLPLRAMLEKSGSALSAKLKLDLLVCSDICVPETHHLSLDIPAGDAAPSKEAALFDQQVKTVPIQSQSFVSAWISSDAENNSVLTVLMNTPEKPSGEADLFVEHPASVGFSKPAISYDAASQIATFKAKARTNMPVDEIQKSIAQAPLRLTFADHNKGIEGTIALQSAPSPAEATATSQAPLEIDLRLLAFALLGGLILNLMPCVLPVLSLKIMSVMSHGGKDNRKTIFKNFTASAAGIIFSFWLMAGVLAAIKSAGGSVGWGIQFQHPAFLVVMMTIVLLFAANMWGLFEIPLPRFIAHRIGKRSEEEPTLTGHFLTGAFATLLATPCTAPFLGTAVGFALAGTTVDIFVIFTFLGLGLALPYIALALSPRAFKYLPKPGKWMVALRKILALALLATALWLGSVLMTVSTQATLDAGWQKFDRSLIAPAVADGKTVIVDVTADWCITCKANKRLVLEQKDVIDALSADNILRLQADWTHRDEDIAAYLRAYGKYGIPFNIVYGPASPDGIVLPELLTKRAVLDALTEATGE